MHKPDLSDPPSLLHLRTLVRVADYGTLASAAKKMLRAASVVHDGIRELERQLGVRLIERTPDKFTLTVEGRCVLIRARRILAELAVLPAMLDQPPVTVHEQLYLLNVRRLSAFVELCRLKNMGRVAKAMDISQPAVSSMVKALEAGTNKVLFERRSRGVHPTDIALAILPAIRRALNELTHIQPDLAALAGEVRGMVRIGALPLSRTRIVPEAIADLLAQHPHVQVKTSEGSFEQLQSDLRAGDLDFVLGALRLGGSNDLVSETLIEENLIVLVRSGHPFIGHSSNLESLIDQQWIMPRAMSPARLLIDRCFREVGLPVPTPAVESGDMAIIRGLLARTDMLAIVSSHQFETDIASGEVVALNVSLEQTRRAIGLMTRRQCLHTPPAAALIASIRAVAAKIP